ncbi:MAG: cysteine methyltransferase [Candidatus Aenigmarchaeota archaeon ex4484_52]|nr:MAG: cysteine methyltransferase [Candidatus Aenigmarchaeota archaeon ex4484_52]
MGDFISKVLKIVKKIPKGKTTTYKKIAIKLGNPNLARAVGNALNKNPNPIKIPCHRVVRSNGFAGGYVSGTTRKIYLLKKEGIEFEGEKILNCVVSNV